jgi:hypothetical protein
MHPGLLSRRQSILWTNIVVVTLLITTLASAQQQPVEKPASNVEQTESERFAALEKSLTGAALVGNFTVTGRENTELTEERYELQSVQHVKGELWLFQARIRYGEHDVVLPLTLPVRWAGDTPVICVDNMGFPGLGTYTARVMIYADHYAGFWSGGDHGGHLFGVIERVNKEEDQTDASDQE